VTCDEYGRLLDHALPREVSNPSDPEYVAPMFNDPEFPEQAPPAQYYAVPLHFGRPRVPAFIVSHRLAAPSVTSGTGSSGTVIARSAPRRVRGAANISNGCGPPGSRWRRFQNPDQRGAQPSRPALNTGRGVEGR